MDQEGSTISSLTHNNDVGNSSCDRCLENVSQRQYDVRFADAKRTPGEAAQACVVGIAWDVLVNPITSLAVFTVLGWTVT